MKSLYQQMKNPDHVGSFKDGTFVNMLVLKSKIFSSIQIRVYLKHFII